MEFSQMRLVALALVPSLALFSCSTSKVETNRVNVENRKECFSVKHGNKIEVSGLEKTKVYWTEKAPEVCPSPGFVLIQVENPKVKNWIQVVETNLDPRPEGVEDASWNLFPGENTFTFIDVSDKYRKLRRIHNNSVNNDLFMDNPRFSVTKGVELIWTAHLYGMRDLKVERRSTIFGIEWGYRLKDGIVTPIRPKILSNKIIQRDFAALKKYLR